MPSNRTASELSGGDHGRQTADTTVASRWHAVDELSMVASIETDRAQRPRQCDNVYHNLRWLMFLGCFAQCSRDIR